MSWAFSGTPAIIQQQYEAQIAIVKDEKQLRLMEGQVSIITEFIQNDCPKDKLPIIEASGHVDEFSAYFKLEIKCYQQ